MYDAFISYSHAKDGKIAAAVQSVIQTLAKPWWQRRAARVFRDDTSLSAAPGLSSALEDALRSARYLLLFASPQAAASKWCGHEVQTWLDTKGTDKLLIALTEGELIWDTQSLDFVWGPETPLPAVMRGRLRNEPLWVDLRTFRQGGEKVSRNNQAFLAAGATLAAPIRGIAKEDLLSEEVANQRRNLMWARGAAAALAALAGLAVWEAVQAAWSRDIARNQRDRAQRVLDQIMASANGRVVSMTERAQEAARTQLEIADTATRGELSRVSLPDASPEIVRATRLLGLAEGYLEREDATAALKAAETALGLLQTWNGSQDELSHRDLGRARAFELAGLAAARLGRPERARRELAQSLELLTNPAATFAPDNAALQARTALVMQHVGDIAVKLQRWEEAEQHYAGALALRAKAAADAGAAVEAHRALAVVHNRVANLELARGRYDAALEANRQARAIIEPLATRSSASDLQRDLATSHHLAADILKAADKPEAALAALDRDLAIVQPLAESAPGHAPWQHDLATTWAKLARLHDELGRTQPALEGYDKSISIGEALCAARRSRPEWLRDLGAALELKGALLTKLGRSREAVLALRRSLAVREQVAASSPDEAWQRELEQAYRRTREVLLRSNHAAEALETAEQQLFATSLAPDDAPGKNERVARALGSLSWTALFAHDPKRAVWAAEQALVLAPQLEFARINHAHALMFAGDAAGARQIYLDGLKAGGAAAAQWRYAIKQDFAELSQRGLQNPQMSEIEKEIEQWE